MLTNEEAGQMMQDDIAAMQARAEAAESALQAERARVGGLVEAMREGVVALDAVVSLCRFSGNAISVERQVHRAKDRLSDAVISLASPTPAPVVDEAKVEAAFARFGARVAKASRDDMGDVDGGDIQDWLEEEGLIVRKQVTEENRNTDHEMCEDVEPGDECLHFTPEAAAAIERPKGGSEG